MGRGLLQNMLSMGWSVCVCISLNFPRNEVYFFFPQSKIKRVGRGSRLQKARYGGEVKSPLPHP